MAPPDPFEGAFPTAPPPISSQTIHIAGILITIYGLSELADAVSSVACLWLLHPRLSERSCMGPVAASIIHSWNTHCQTKKSSSADSSPNAGPVGLIALSFDQRNHGSRLVDELANQAWNAGNPRHAQDMFSIYQGTAMDVSVLMDHLPSYIFLDPALPTRRITTNLVLGISLGGHSVWHCLFHEPRITAGVVVIGCPDFERLMCHRAAKSKLQTWTGTAEDFKGSKDYPAALVETVSKHDPAGILMSGLNCQDGRYKEYMPSQDEKEKLGRVLANHLSGKRILNMAGGADKLVPYDCAVPFLQLLEGVISRNAGMESCDIVLEDIVFEGTGHALSPRMMADAIRFLTDTLSGGSPSRTFKHSTRRESKM